MRAGSEGTDVTKLQYRILTKAPCGAFVVADREEGIMTKRKVIPFPRQNPPIDPRTLEHDLDFSHGVVSVRLSRGPWWWPGTWIRAIARFLEDLYSR